MSRPPVPFEAEPGYEWRAVPDPDWTTEPSIVDERRCRWGASGHRKGHGVSAAAVLFRRRYDGRPVPYAYCAEHLYGRWIEAEPGPWQGRVLSWVLRDVS